MSLLPPKLSRYAAVASRRSDFLPLGLIPASLIVGAAMVMRIDTPVASLGILPSRW